MRKRVVLDFESRHEPLVSRQRFSNRLFSHILLAGLFIVTALAIGMAGYMYFEDMTVLDAFVNAAMILSGMGPMKTDLQSGTKVFAGIYAIACGLLLFAVAGLVLAPVLHRILHVFHLDSNDRGK
jgi:hypothetical protein